MKQSKANSQKYGRLRRRQAAVLLLFVLLMYAVLPRLDEFNSSWQVIGAADTGWLVTALGASLATYVAASGVYVFLAGRSLGFIRTSLVQLAGNFVNRLLPAGIGAIGVNFAYLRRQKRSKAQSTAIILLNNVLGFVGNMALLAFFVVSGRIRPKALHVPSLSGLAYVSAGIIIIAALWIIAAKFAPNLKRKVYEFYLALKAYRHSPLKIAGAGVMSVALTLLYSLCLLACARAVGVEISLPALFVIMSLGVAGATVTPTPGGLGGAEAALVAGLVVYGADSSTALAVTLLYRLYTYWLPLVAGAGAFAYCRRRKYI